MAEYIEREAALRLCGWYNTVNGKSICAARKDELASLPAADVVEVVRCKDCKHLGKAVRLFAGDAPVDIASCTAFKMSPITLNEFCSYGERRGKDG